jgi:glyoxylase-like metal-dependent hydrolase (beta-lactamase superfamily II)
MGFAFKAKSELKGMAPIETNEIISNIFAVKSSIVNLFLIKTGDQYIAIDGGNNVKTINNELIKLNIDPNNITAVFLTHTDFDHVAAIKLFTNAKIYLSEQEEQLINGNTARFYSIVGNKIDTKNYELLEDKQILKIGDIKIQGLLIPGHTPGTMCYVINDKYLFTGDALSIKDGKIDKFNEFFNMDTKMAINSIEKLIGIPGMEYIFTAHYGYTDDYATAVQDWKK